jgi:hypothetical protein
LGYLAQRSKRVGKGVVGQKRFARTSVHYKFIEFQFEGGSTSGFEQLRQMFGAVPGLFTFLLPRWLRPLGDFVVRHFKTDGGEGMSGWGGFHVLHNTTVADED